MRKLILSLCFAGLLASCSETASKLPQQALALKSSEAVQKELMQQNQPACCELPRLPKVHPKISSTKNTCTKRAAINAKVSDARKISEAEWLRRHYNDVETGTSYTVEYEVAGTEFIPAEMNGERCYVERNNITDNTHHIKTKKHLVTEGVPVVMN